MIYISIGSNIENRLHHIQTALKLLKKQGFNILLSSPIIETPAILPENAPASWNKPYFNMVIAGTTSLTPEKLFEQLKAIEIIMGREKDHTKWSPRIIDLDILLFNQEQINTELLTIPHAELLNRNFLVHLLALIAPNEHHPVINKTFGEIAHNINTKNIFIKNLTAFPALIGIVNITPDSFSDGGKYLDPDAATARVMQLHEEGASIIELGAQSTRPGAVLISPEQEYERLRIILENLSSFIREKKIILSIDSFYPEVILKILEKYNISWINDVKGSFDDSHLKQIAERGCGFIAMHSLSIPPSKNNILDFQESPIALLKIWGEQKIEYLTKQGFDHTKIILDPGIGFGKTAYQSFDIINNIKQLKTLNIPLCVGHARKSFITAVNNISAAHERDIETLAISGQLAKNQVDYLRVHNIAEHQRFLAAQFNMGNI